MQQDSSSAAAPRTAPDPLCAGRETELGRLTSLYRDAQRGDSCPVRLVVVEGPSGIGKSRVLGELRSRVRLQGGVVLEGRCEPGQAFGPFAEIVERALRFLDEVGVASEVDLGGLSCIGGCHRLWHQHGGFDADRAPSTEVPGATPETAAFEKRMRFFDTVAALLRDVARVRAPLVVLDHLERADRGTLELLEFLLEGSAEAGEAPLRALFVASVRREGGAALPHDVDALLAHERTARVELGALDVEGVRAYLQSPRALQRILERTGGSPEAIDLLLEADPLSPEDRLARRLGALAPAARAMVEALAVLGRPATLDELRRIAGLEASASERASVAALDLLGRSVADGRLVFAFDREIDRERAYALLAPERQRALHARCADVCAESVELQEAVRHALAARDHARASDLAVVAAASLSARHAHEEAAALLESLVAAVGAAPLSIREQLADLYRVAGDYRQALSHARIVRDTTPDDPIAAHRVGQLLTMAGEHGEAALVLEAARRQAEQQGLAAIAAEIVAQLAELHYQRAAYEEAARCAESALATAEEAGDLIIEIQARNALGKIALAQKNPHAATGLFEENRVKAAYAGLGHQEAQAHTNLGVAMLLARDLRGAERACLMAIEVASRASDTRDRAIATENLAVLAHLDRDYRRALGYYHEAIALLKRLGNRSMLTRVAHNLGELYASLGDHGRARALRQYARRIGGAGLPPQVLGEGLLLDGRIEAAEGNISAAREAFVRARDTFRALGSIRWVEAAIELARMALYDGDVAAARAILAELPVDLPAKHQADLALVSADLERAAGDDPRTSARRAVELAEACDDPERLLAALVRHARALGDVGEVGLATRVAERAQKLDEELSRRVPEESSAAWAERAQRAELARVAGSLASAWTLTRHESDPPPRALSGPRPRPGMAAPGASEARLAAWRKRYPNLVGSSSSLAGVLHVLDKVAGTDALVLIRGESGTGKELVADALHRNSPRRNRAFVKVNCAALVETLLLSELFGHERGAFTGADSRKKGRFELADGGTIFLDEIGDISPKTQVALLRVLQERVLERVGGTQPIKVDVRIVAATHRDLEQMVRDGRFREDLYYRLRGVTVEMPPLRERTADLPELCHHLLGRIAAERGERTKRMSPEALECLSAHRWPGNVRELENVLRSATLFADGPALVPDDFAAFAEAFVAVERPARPLAGVGPDPRLDRAQPIETLVYERIRGGESSLLEMKKRVERECVQRALLESEGNITRAAALLGMKRPRLSQLVKLYGLKAED